MHGALGGEAFNNKETNYYITSLFRCKDII